MNNPQDNSLQAVSQNLCDDFQDGINKRNQLKIRNKIWIILLWNQGNQRVVDALQTDPVVITVITKLVDIFFYGLCLKKKPLNPSSPGDLSFGSSLTMESISSLVKGSTKTCRSKNICVSSETPSLLQNSCQKGYFFHMI